jgi:Serpentine type 7TM GPCR chemoreceptor Srh
MGKCVQILSKAVSKIRLTESSISDTALLVGYSPIAASPQPPSTPARPSPIAYLALLIHAAFLGTIVVVLILYSLLIREIWHSIRKSCRKATSHHRRAIVFMLTSRVMVPLLLGFFPVLALTINLHLGWWEPLDFGWNCALVGVAMTHGLWNSLATVAVFGPYRKGILKAANMVLPRCVANRVGLAPWDGTNSWYRTQTKDDYREGTMAGHGTGAGTMKGTLHSGGRRG